MSFEDRVALVTGGSRGIGAALVDEIARSGAVVYYTFRSWNDKAKKDLDRGEAGNVLPVQCDVSDYESVKKLIRDIVASRGHIDFVVNNAGVNQDKPFALTSAEEWSRIIDVNLMGTVHVCRCVVLKMIKQKFGKIVNIASVSGLLSPAYQSNYAASKAGVVSLTRSLAKEVARYGITVNAVAPGFIETDMVSTLPEEKRKAHLEIVPMNRYGEPSEVASLVVYLLSEKANYITGEIIKIDGGLGA